MRSLHSFLGAWPLFLALAVVAFACGGSSSGSGFGDGGTDDATSGAGSGGGGGSGSGSGGSGSGSLTGNDGGGSGGGPGMCTGLECSASSCSPGSETTLTGTVYDPAGNLPLYNVYVYIPNSATSPIQPGHPECTQCEAPASGQPIVGVSTDATGKFTLTKGSGFGVPTGNNGGKGIPLVLQVGKWRKQLTLPSIAPCTTTNLDTTLNAGSGKARQLRLPSKASEGDMPLIAFTSGCDPAECFLRHVGIDDSEFVAATTADPPAFPQTTPGTGHVHFYTARDDNNGTAASAVAGGGTPAATYQWWTSSANLLHYDIVFNACECNPNDRGATAYGAMDVYLKGGGRLFTTHYYGNWFIPQTGTADLQSVASWASVQTPGGGLQGSWNGTPTASPETDTVDQSFPKGMAYATWLQTVGVSSTPGSISLADTRDDIIAPKPAGCSGASCLSTRWIYHPGDNHPRYLSFNTPVGQPVTSQCGRAVYSDVHLSGASNDQTFPAECNDPNIDNPPGHAVNEKALEFLFFDLSSCVQNDTMPPPPPPGVQ